MDDQQLEEQIRIRLQEDPVHYLRFLKDIIDEATPSIAITDEAILEGLKPRFSGYRNGKKIAEACETGDFSEVSEEDSDLVPSRESVDSLFFPCVRARLYEWQRAYFDKRLGNRERREVKGRIAKVSRSLCHIGTGRTHQAIPEEIKQKIIMDYPSVSKASQEVFKEAKTTSLRKRLTIEKIPEGRAVVEECIIFPRSFRELRSEVLARRYGVKRGSVDDFLYEEYAIFKYFKNKAKRVVAVEAEYTDEGERIVIQYEDGSQTETVKK